MANFLSDEARRLLEEVADPKLRIELQRIYREHPDGKGRRREVNSSPLPGSHKYPWLRRPKPLAS